MQHTAHIAKNALLSIPDPNVAIMKKCEVLPIEFVVRGYVTGTHVCTYLLNYDESCQMHKVILFQIEVRCQH